MRYSLTRVSRNAKVGPLPVVTASRDTCPTTCALKNSGGCYAEMGPLALHWNRVDREGIDIDQLCTEIRKLPKQQLWRYGQAGDLPKSEEDLNKLVKANAGRPVIAYSHRRDIELINKISRLGFHVNVSCDNTAEVDALAKGMSAAVVVPSTFQRRKDETLKQFRERLGGRLKMATPEGRPVALCPQTYLDGVSCASCGLCAAPRVNDTVIAFPAHGSRRRAIDRRLAE